MVTRPSWMSDGSSGVDHVRIVSGFGEVLVTETVKDGGEVGGEGAERESGRLERVVVCGEDILIWNGRVRPVRRLKRCSVVMAVRFMVVLVMRSLGRLWDLEAWEAADDVRNVTCRIGCRSEIW